MAITAVSILIIMAAYFLLLYGAVGFIQDKRFFSSAPKENLAAIPDKQERFPGAHIVGWVIVSLALALFLGAAILAAWDGAKRRGVALLPKCGEHRPPRHRYLDQYVIYITQSAGVAFDSRALCFMIVFSHPRRGRRGP